MNFWMNYFSTVYSKNPLKQHLLMSHLHLIQIIVRKSFILFLADLHTNKCKTKEWRAKAFSVLNLLCSYSSKIRDVVYNDCLLKMVSRITRPENFVYVPESESRSLYSYSGFKHLGATWYMNSMIQQLYMIPSFKYLLLSVNDQKNEELNTVDDEKSVYLVKWLIIICFINFKMLWDF